MATAGVRPDARDSLTGMPMCHCEDLFPYKSVSRSIVTPPLRPCAIRPLRNRNSTRADTESQLRGSLGGTNCQNVVGPSPPSLAHSKDSCRCPNSDSLRSSRKSLTGARMRRLARVKRAGQPRRRRTPPQVQSHALLKAKAGSGQNAHARGRPLPTVDDQKRRYPHPQPYDGMH